MSASEAYLMEGSLRERRRAILGLDSEASDAETQAKEASDAETPAKEEPQKSKERLTNELMSQIVTDEVESVDGGKEQQRAGMLLTVQEFQLSSLRCTREAKKRLDARKLSEKEAEHAEWFRQGVRRGLMATAAARAQAVKEQSDGGGGSGWTTEDSGWQRVRSAVVPASRSKATQRPRGLPLMAL